MRKRLAVVVGHNSVSQGAIRKGQLSLNLSDGTAPSDVGVTEFAWNSDLANIMAEHADFFDIDMRIFKRTDGGGYRNEIARVYAEVDNWGADASIELHFNSADDPTATGSEVLSSGTALSLRLAAEVQNEIVATLNTRDRGVKTLREQDRGGGSLFSGKAPAILVEPFFGSNKADLSATDEQSEKVALAKAYLRGAKRAFESFPRRDLNESRTMDAVRKQRGAKAGVMSFTALAASVRAIDHVVKPIDGIAQIVSNWSPIVLLTSLIAAIGFVLYSNYQTERIENARKDDFEKEIR
jgi:N-acetylmuramoyl-L-alanine amidase